MKARASKAESKADSNSDLESELKALMIASLEGDQKSYQTFLAKAAYVLRGYLLKSGSAANYGTKGRAGTVDDCVQDILLSVHQKKSTYRTDLPLLPWLLTIARYRMIDNHRSQVRQPKTDQYNEQVHESAVPSETYEDVDLDKLFETLPEKQRLVLRLAKVEELPLAEVSARTGMSLAAVKVTIHRAVATLKKRYTDDD
jgi:RNA polymerase sigma-70 factor, ECF subfamily